jgi:hypothetical protein
MPRETERMGFQPTATKETVIVVHGTFAKSGAEVDPCWWERGGKFCRQLDCMLEEYGSVARCWAHDGECFSWSGENSWTARAKAASELRAYIYRLIKQGWTCHVVAHSHGGTVLLEALRDMWGERGVGWLCTLGTPYLTLNARPLWPFRVNARPYLWVALLAALTLAIVALGAFSTHPWWSSVLLGVFVVSAILDGLSLWIAKTGFNIGVGPRSYDFTDTPSGSERLLVIGCEEDEAFQFLNGLKKMENPLPRTPFKPALAFRENLRTARALDAIRFSTEGFGIAALLVHVAVIPIRIFLFIWSVGWSWVWSLGRPLARTRAWSVVQSALFGVAGSPVGIDQVDVSHRPAAEGGAPFVYEPLECRIVFHAISRRTASTRSTGMQITRVLNALSEGGDIFGSLKDVLLSVDLVHASYYQDDLAIKRIALWFSIPAEERLLWAAKVHDDNNPLSEEKRVPEENRKAYAALLSWRDGLSESEQKCFAKRGALIHNYRGCCHASDSYALH